MTTYLNMYKCSDCNHSWSDEWNCMCDDRCPECNTAMTPYESIDITSAEELADSETNYYIDCNMCGKHVDNAYIMSLVEENIVCNVLQKESSVENVLCKECGEKVQTFIAKGDEIN